MEGEYMPGNKLENVRVAAIMTDGFEQIEFTGPRDALIGEGAVVHIVSPAERRIQGMHHHHLGGQFEIDIPIDQANPEDYDAVILPGGVVNADKLRENVPVQNFLRHINEQNKLIAVICHGPWTLISAGLVAGKRMTSFHTLKDDLINAGARWADEPVIEDDNFLSSRHPGDLEEFNRHLIDKLARTEHAHAHKVGERG
jgi:protease I